MKKFIIHGGKPLKGTVTIGGAKNSSFKLLIAAILTQGESKILNVPQIDETQITTKIIDYLGGKITTPGERTIFINPMTLKSSRISKDFGSKSRASIMFAGPLLKRFGNAYLPLPGGDKVGKRPIERHLEGLKALTLL